MRPVPVLLGAGGIIAAAALYVVGFSRSGLTLPTTVIPTTVIPTVSDSGGLTLPHDTGAQMPPAPEHNSASVVAKLITTPLPPDSHAGWSLAAPPFIVEDGDPDAGEQAEVQAQFANGNRTAGFSFRVFETNEQARASFDMRYTFAQQLVALTAPAGGTAKCLGGSSQALCHALVGRTVLVVTMDGAEIPTVALAIGELAAHVRRLDR